MLMNKILEHLLSSFTEWDEHGRFVGTIVPHPDYTSQYPLTPTRDPREFVPETPPAVEDETPFPNFYPPTPDEEKCALHSLLFSYGFPADVDIDVEHSDDDKIITLSDGNGDIVAVLGVDDDGSVYGISSAHNDLEDEDEYVTIMDLSDLDPELIGDDETQSVDLSNPDWLDSDAFMALFSSDMEGEDVGEANELTEKIVTRRATRRMRIAVRGGKVMRVPIFRRVRKAVLSPKQRAALRKMQMKAHSARANANRKRSIRRREQMHI